jgi:dihydroneopterin aldolase
LDKSGNGAVLGYKNWQDQIKLAGIKIYPRIGTDVEERSAAQECQADLTLWGDFEAAAATDALDMSIDYCQVLLAVQETANAREYNLMEALAYRIVRTILQGFPVNRVKVKLRKCPASLVDQIAYVEVEVQEP